MDSDDLFESEDDTEVNTECWPLTLYELDSLMNEILMNEKITNATEVFYKVFNSILANSITGDNFHRQSSVLLKLSAHLEKLKYSDKFHASMFSNYVITNFSKVSLDVIWWLEKHGVMYLAQFLHFLQHEDVSANLLCILKRDEENEIFVSQIIVQDILLDLIRGCYRPNAGIYNLLASTTWSTYCTNFIDQLVSHILEDVTNEVHDGFVTFLPIINSLRNYLPKIMLEQFFKSILMKFLTHKTDEITIYCAYTYQELWCSQNISPTLKVVYDEIFMDFCNMQTIIDIIEEVYFKINWKFTMTAVGVCTQKSNTGLVDAKATTLKYLDMSIKFRQTLQFFTGLLIIRQACLENINNYSYKRWYADMFGFRNEKTRYQGSFKYYISLFTKLVPYEPKSYLKIHIEQAMFVPTMCNSVMYDFKKMCKARMEELND